MPILINMMHILLHKNCVYSNGGGIKLGCKENS